MSGPERAGPRAYLRNLREYDAGLGRKLSLLVRNMTSRAVKGQLCCGHPGEPGC